MATLQSLPPELRLKIYEYLQPGDIAWKFEESGWSIEPCSKASCLVQLSRTSRLLRHECRERLRPKLRLTIVESEQYFNPLNTALCRSISLLRCDLTIWIYLGPGFQTCLQLLFRDLSLAHTIRRVVIHFRQDEDGPIGSILPTAELLHLRSWWFLLECPRIEFYCTRQGFIEQYLLDVMQGWPSPQKSRNVS